MSPPKRTSTYLPSTARTSAAGALAAPASVSGPGRMGFEAPPMQRQRPVRPASPASGSTRRSSTRAAGRLGGARGARVMTRVSLTTTSAPAGNSDGRSRTWRCSAAPVRAIEDVEARVVAARQRGLRDAGGGERKVEVGRAHGRECYNTAMLRRTAVAPCSAADRRRKPPPPPPMAEARGDRRRRRARRARAPRARRHPHRRGRRRRDERARVALARAEARQSRTPRCASSASRGTR